MGCCYIVRNPEVHELSECGLSGFDSTTVFDHVRCGLAMEKRDHKRPDSELENRIINYEEEEEEDLLTLELPNPTSEVSLASWRYPNSPQSFK